MTDWNCKRCKLNVRRFDSTRAPCPQCGESLTLGRHRGYRTDPRHDEHHAWESEPEATRRTLDWRPAP